jgi:hypothetical protein
MAAGWLVELTPIAACICTIAWIVFCVCTELKHGAWQFELSARSHARRQAASSCPLATEQKILLGVL